MPTPLSTQLDILCAKVPLIIHHTPYRLVCCNALIDLAVELRGALVQSVMADVVARSASAANT